MQFTYSSRMVQEELTHNNDGLGVRGSVETFQISMLINVPFGTWYNAHSIQDEVNRENNIVLVDGLGRHSCTTFFLMTCTPEAKLLYL